MARPVWFMPQANQAINQVPLPESWIITERGKKQKNNSEKGKKISHFGVKEARVTTRRAVYCIGECIVT